VEVPIMAKDPVCGMQVDKQQAAAKGLTSEYQGQTYYFCAPGCKREFDQDPQRYTERQPASG
jgi:YHS domain-containing protein